MHATRIAWVIIAAALVSCAKEDSTAVRGRGMTVALLAPDEQAHVYEAAVRAGFEVDDPALSLLLDSRLLPRGVGLLPEGRVSDSVAAELRHRGVIKGDCEPPLQSGLGPPHCAAARPGYVVRFSPVFILRTDSMQVYAYLQKYDTPNSEPSQTLRFERAYQIVRHDGAWKAVREGHVGKEVRGESK